MVKDNLHECQDLHFPTRILHYSDTIDAFRINCESGFKGMADRSVRVLIVF